MKIDTIIEILNYLNFDHQIKHTNDCSEIIIPTNNDFRNVVLLFDCEDRIIYNKDFIEED